MALTYMCGFEMGSLKLEPGLGVAPNPSATPTADVTVVRTGAYSLKCAPIDGGVANLSFGNNLASGSSLRFYLRVTSLPASASTGICGSVVASNSNVMLNSDGTLTLRINTTAQGTTAIALTNTTRWYLIEIENIGGSPALRVEGTLEVSGGAATFFVVLGSAQAAPAGGAYTAYFDDMAVFDTTGVSNPGATALAVPISDDTITGVTDNNGVATNIYQCVDNIPPAGVASANEAANAKAGMHFPASTTCNYIANLQTYTTLGVGVTGTVLAVQSIVRHGEDIATGTKNLQNVGELTNPTVAGASVAAGGGGGAHAAESGANVWVTTFGTLTASPSVTVGTSPTIRTSRTSESRLACVDFMGMYVAWTPGARNPIRQNNQAVARASSY